MHSRTTAAIWLAGAAICGLAAPAFAQGAEQSVGDAAEQGVGEIVVTAQKRSESLQRTPIAISAIPAAQLDLQGIAEAKDLSAIAPNLSVVGATTNATAAVISIRGIPTSADETQGYDSSIGVYVDGIYMARSSAATFEVADIERVEVLRGPQGTLFGRNTTGGAVNFITRAPSSEAGLSLRAGIGNYDMRTARAVFNTGTLADSLRMSFSYLYKQRDGIVDNLLAAENRDPGSSLIHSARWSAQLDLGDRVKITNIFDWTRVEGVAGYQQLSAVGNGNTTDFPSTLSLGGNVFPVVQPANVLGYLNEATSLDARCGTPVSQISTERRTRVCNNSAQPSVDKLWGNMTRVEADLDWLTIRSTTAARWWRNHIAGSDLDGMGAISGPAFSQASLLNGMPLQVLDLIPTLSPAARTALAAAAVPTTTQDLFSTRNDRRQKQFSQELEFVSNSGGAFEWVLGAFYFKESGAEFNPQSYAFVIDTNAAVFNAGNFGALAPLLQAGNPARYRALAVQSALGYTSDSESFAVYGQGTLRPGGPDGRLGITLGLRYSWDSKDFQVYQNGATPFTDAQLPNNTSSKKFSAPTGNLTVDYRASDDVNLYARLARGYRSGGFNARQNTSSIPLTPFNKETIWSYELGIKTQFNNRVRLNAAVFYNEYKDQLVTLPVPVGEGQSFGNITVNAGKTRYYGAEIEGRFVVDDHLSLDAAAGYVKTDPRDFPAGDVNNVIRNVASIQHLGYAPEFTGNVGATYRRPIGSQDLTARVGYNYTSSFWMFGNPLTAPFGRQTKGDARGLLDAQIRLDRIAMGSAEASLTLWGKNITNKSYVVRAVDFGQLGFATTIYGDPRTYGLTLDVKF